MTGKEQLKTLKSLGLIARTKQVQQQFIVAKYLGPEEYGILKSVELIQMLNKFGNLEFIVNL